MTQKEKIIVAAREFVLEFLPLAHDWESENKFIAKKIALKCIDKIIEANPSKEKLVMTMTGQHKTVVNNKAYWRKFKREIENLNL